MTTSSGSLPLYLAVDEPVGLAAAMPLSLFGATGSGQWGAMGLFVGGYGPFWTLPLSVVGTTPGEVSGHLPLSVVGEAWRAQGRLSCVLGGNPTASGALPLFIRGSGTTDGCLPLFASVSLFVKTLPGGGIPLFVSGPGTPLSRSISLFAAGATVASGTMPLALPAAIGAATARTRLVTFGS
jgi:hypothetical protein